MACSSPHRDITGRQINFKVVLCVCIGGSKGGARDAPPGVQILSFSCSFLQNICKLIALLGVGHPPQENPGSATGLCAKKACKHHHVDKSDVLSSRLRLINQAIPCPVMNTGTISIVHVAYMLSKPVELMRLQYYQQCFTASK